jgi:neutral ceramidase
MRREAAPGRKLLARSAASTKLASMSPVLSNLCHTGAWNSRNPLCARLAMLALCYATILTSPGSRAADLRAGVAKVDITPHQPVTMAGYESRKDLSKGVHDPLSARALAFEHDGRRLVLVSTDVLGFYGGSAPIIRQAILDECDLRPEELFLAAIHTHSAPTVTFDATRGHSNNVAYSKWLQERLVEVVRSALTHPNPVQIGFGFGSSPVGANRRETTQDENRKPKIILGRNPDAPIDRQVQVVSVTSSDSTQARAVLFNFATHSTSLGPGNYIISGDVHGLAEQFVERYLDRDVVVAGFAGASGNIDPWYRVLPGFNSTNGWVPESVLLGTLLGEEVVHVLGKIKQPAPGAPIKGLFKTVQLPAKPKPETPAGKTPTAALNITAARVGDVALVGLGAEVFNEIGLAIKAASPFPCTVVITHCNGTAGYLPTQASYADGGYEVQSSPFAAGAAELITQHVSEMLQELR